MKAIIGRIYTIASHIYVIEVKIIELSPSLPILSGFSGLHELYNAQVAQPLSLLAEPDILYSVGHWPWKECKTIFYKDSGFIIYVLYEENKINTLSGNVTVYLI